MSQPGTKESDDTGVETGCCEASASPQAERAESGQAKLLYGLKVVNMVLAVGWGFLFTYVLVRAVGPETFAVLAILNAVGVSLGVADLGLAKVALLRLAYEPSLVARTSGEDGVTAESADTQDRIRTGLATLYLAVTVVVVIAATAFVHWSVADFDLTLLTALFFPSAALGLPWLLLQQFSLARGKYLQFEAVDFFRRVGQVAALSLAAAGLPLLLAFGFILSVWLVALLYGARISALVWSSWRNIPSALIDGGGFVARNWVLLKHSVAYNVSEILIYQFPLIVTPIVYGLGWPVLTADIFFKLHRGVTLGYRAASESALPQLISAFRGSDRSSCRAVLLRITLLSIPVAIAAGLLLFGAGDALLVALFGNGHKVPAGVLMAVFIFCCANGVQNLSGSFLLNVGCLRQLRNVNFGVLGGITALVLIVSGLGWPVEQLLSAYAVVYWLGAIALLVYAIGVVRGMPSNEL